MEVILKITLSTRYPANVFYVICIHANHFRWK